MSEYILHHFLRVATDFVPETHDRLTTIGPKFMLKDKRGKYRPHQVCKCICGCYVVKASGSIKAKESASCGCRKREVDRKKCIDMSYKHGNAARGQKRSEYSTWTDIKKRCHNPKATRFNHYGGRGIKVCDRWLEPDGRGFVNFLADMGPKPSTKHSIDRIDVNGHYCPKNCRWATNKEQCNNKRNNVLITANGKTQTLTQWADELGVCFGSLASRVRYGWSDDAIINTPIRKHKEYVNAIRSK
jgi:hypothetical protein